MRDAPIVLFSWLFWGVLMPVVLVWTSRPLHYPHLVVPALVVSILMGQFWVYYFAWTRGVIAAKRDNARAWLKTTKKSNGTMRTEWVVSERFFGNFLPAILEEADQTT